MKNVADILEEAADLIQVRGLAKETYEDQDGRLCSFGAMSVASGRESWNPKTSSDAFKHWCIWTHKIYEKNPILWNDEPERTAEEVIDALKLAAKDWRNETPLP